MQQTFDHFEFETVLPAIKRISVGSDSLGQLEKGGVRPSLEGSSSSVVDSARRLSSAVARMSRQFFGDSAPATNPSLGETERRNVNPYLRARELDKQRQTTGVVDIKKPSVSIAALTSPAAFKLSLKRTFSSTSASTSVSTQAWNLMDTSTAPVPPIPAHMSSLPGSVRSSSEGRSSSSGVRPSMEEQHRSTSSLPKLKTLQLPASRAAGLVISPDPFRKEAMKSGWY